MKTFQLVLLTNVVFVAVVVLAILLWPKIGSIVGYGNSWWLAPLASFLGFLIAGRVIKDADRGSGCWAQIAVLGLFCLGVFLWSLLIENLGIPAWRIALTLALSIAGTWLGRLALGSVK